MPCCGAQSLVCHSPQRKAEDEASESAAPKKPKTLEESVTNLAHLSYEAQLQHKKKYGSRRLQGVVVPHKHVITLGRRWGLRVLLQRCVRGALGDHGSPYGITSPSASAL